MSKATTITLPETSWSQRLLVVLEVSLAMLLLPVVRIAFKHLAPHELVSATISKAPMGVVFIAPVIALLLFVRGQRFKAYGVTSEGWTDGLKIGVLLSLLTAGAVIVSLPLFRLAGVTASGWETRGLLLAMCFLLPGLALVAIILRSYAPIVRRIPTAMATLGLVGLWAFPLVLVRYFDRPLSPAVLTLAVSVLVVGPGEEFIFRGYIQSRLNQVFGRPFHFCGVQYGWGLLLASFLFGFVHILNGVDFVTGNFKLQWAWGLGSFMTGLIFGALREKTGSILGGAILHGNNDAWVLIVHGLK